MTKNFSRIIVALTLLTGMGNAAAVTPTLISTTGPSLVCSVGSNLITNGSFENLPTTGSNVTSPLATFATPTPLVVPGWSFTGGGTSSYNQACVSPGVAPTGLNVSYCPPSNFYAVKDGNNVIYMGNGDPLVSITGNPIYNATLQEWTFTGTPVITPKDPTFGTPTNPTVASTTFPTVIGNTYRFSFQVGGEGENNWYSSPGIFEMSVAGAVQNTPRYNAVLPTQTGNLNYVFEFTAAATSATLSLRNWGHAGLTTVGWAYQTATELLIDNFIACEMPRNASVTITKTDNKSATVSGTTNAYVMTVANAGPNNANGVIVTDVYNANLTCPALAGVTCAVTSGSAVCPTGPLTFSNLTAGLAINTLPSTSSLSFSYTCNVN